MGHGFGFRRAVDEGGHGAALRVAADDDVAHAELVDGELDGGGGGIGVARDVGGWDDVADVFHDEEVARLALGDQFREDAGIGAGDEERVWVLFLARKSMEERAVTPELVLLEFMKPAMSCCMTIKMIGGLSR